VARPKLMETKARDPALAAALSDAHRDRRCDDSAVPLARAISAGAGRRRRPTGGGGRDLVDLDQFGLAALARGFAGQRSTAMLTETAVMLFAIVIPFAIFAGVLGWAQSRAK
jgi:hypothetical protein